MRTEIIAEALNIELIHQINLGKICINFWTIQCLLKLFKVIENKMIYNLLRMKKQEKRLASSVVPMGSKFI